MCGEAGSCRSGRGSGSGMMECECGAVERFELHYLLSRQLSKGRVSRNYRQEVKGRKGEGEGGEGEGREREGGVKGRMW